MHKVLFTALALAASMTIAHADPAGGSSSVHIVAGPSSAIPFGAGKAGISINDSFSINLDNGPVKFIKQKYANTPINNNSTQNVNGALNPKYLMMKDVSPVIGFFNNQTLGQVWYEKRENGTDVYSIRQIADPALPVAPKFGGLVIAKVPNLPADANVFFGEWAPRAGNPTTGSSTDLNLSHADHTVWFSGDKPTGNTQNLASASYKVVGVNQHVPGQNDFYSGTLNAVFTGTNPTLTGSLIRGTDTIAFTKVAINTQNGTFNKGSEINGRFYGAGATALAGYTTRGTTDRRDDVAFGGYKQ